MSSLPNFLIPTFFMTGGQQGIGGEGGGVVGGGVVGCGVLNYESYLAY